MPNTDTHSTPLSTISRQPTEINDLIGNPPGWILRSGITIIALVVIIGIALSNIISYPDKIMAPVVITTEQPPIDLVTKVSGKLETIFKNDKDTVNKDEQLLYIENTANPKDIRKVEMFFTKYEKIDYIPDYLRLNFYDKLLTGELNNEISAFSQKYKSFQNLLRQSMVFQKIRSIDNEIQRIKNLNQLQSKQIEIYKNEVAIKEKDYNRNVTLHNQAVISDSEKEKMEAELLVYKRQLENMKSGVISNKIRIEQLKTQILELTDKRHQEVQTYVTDLDEQKAKIKNKIKDWRDKYFITAPINGIFTLSGTITKDAFVNAGTTVGSIVPLSESNTKNIKIARANTQISGVGKIEKGSKTIIRFDAYPYKEYGTINTSVKDISLLPVRDKEGKVFYDLTISLPDTLTTNYNKTIPYRPNMSGIALIITKDRTVFERIFDKFLNIVKNQ